MLPMAWCSLNNIVIVPPVRKCLSSTGERDEQRLVQKVVLRPSIKVLDKGILSWLAGRDVKPADPGLLRPALDRDDLRLRERLSLHPYSCTRTLFRPRPSLSIHFLLTFPCSKDG